MNDQPEKSTTSTTERLVGSGSVTLNPFAANVTPNTTERATVIVIGDVIVDEWVTVSPVKVSPEHPGVVWLRGDAVTSMGAADTVAETLSRLGVGTLLLAPPPVSRKRRYLYDGQIVFRTDLEETPTYDSEPLGRALSREAEGVSLVLVSDYAKGAIDRYIIEVLTELEVPVWLDPHPKGKYGALSPRIVKCNATEYKQFERRFPGAAFIVTHGAGGAEAVLPDSRLRIPTGRTEQAKCVVGAGDCFFGALAAEYLFSKNNLIAAIKYATSVASAAVMRRGRCLPDPQERR